MNQTEILRQERLKKAELLAEQSRHTELVGVVKDQTATTIKAFNAFTKYVDRKITKTEVVNQLKQIGTPDAMKVMSAVNDMHSTLKKLKNTDLTPVAKLLEDLIGEVSQIPKESPEVVESVEVNNLPDFDSYTTRIEDAVKALDVRPVVNVQAPQVTVKPADVHIEKQDFTTLEKALKQVVSAVENIVIPAQIPTDMTKVEKKLDTANKHLEKISNKSFGGGGGSGGHTTPYVDADGKPVYVEREADGSVPVTIVNPEDISGGSSTGGATEESQEDQTQVLNQILSAISAVASARGIASDLRVTLLGGTTAVTGTLTAVTTVTTVATVSNQTNIGGLPATQIVPATTNTTAVLSNINNIV